MVNLDPTYSLHVQGDHLVEAKSPGDGVRDKGSAGSARSFCWLGGCARPSTRGCGGGGALFSAESGYCRPE
jgi:hypothetical protein